MDNTFSNNRITDLFRIKNPVIQGGMVWCSGWKLASAVSNNGGLGLLGAGSMYPQVLREHIQKMHKATQKPWGVNVPLLYPDIEELMQVIVDEGVKIVFTSAGSPAKWTPYLKEHGIIVAHVIANSRLAKKCEDAGVDAIVAEGFEAGGHEGREETTTMNLIPLVRKVTSLPLIAAGGIGSGQQILAAMALGADGVQIGSLFALSEESSAHKAFKETAVNAKEGDTMLTLKQLAPVRLLKNHFFKLVEEAQQRGASPEELKELLGRGRAKKGIFEGNLDEGELEIGQVAALVEDVKPVSQIMKSLLEEFQETKKNICR
ncbi:nitronate monooxygenase family protein [Marinilabilia salmonicolor]|jgi:enoyl-[acyl-carrier protein] reductase II|uniref:Enoyl-[acyl-carrier protein] reductase II n=1 Tax=Marinilabilia salmonicolor TaxID=989 RepID=A0A2T0XNY5_9BACT|nr:nitronate monooxygenase [Marinilabilia salmonicolor]PRZ00636.1 enoyl-[acyl-carrier protein] reductase II [Marinilabilia salmonicolor]RCW30850.1 enoyl-[acyl-carrier protein] reductase II [Marinilabilia salmonicolor]